MPENTDISNQGAEHFIGSGLEAYFDKTLGENGAFIVEQYWVHSLNFDYEKQGDNIVMKRLWTYRFKPDVILSPLIKLKCIESEMIRTLKRIIVT